MPGLRVNALRGKRAEEGSQTVDWGESMNCTDCQVGQGRNCACRPFREEDARRAMEMLTIMCIALIAVVCALVWGQA
jgi:hypothetical protein